MTFDLAVAALVAVGLVFTVVYTFLTGISPVPTNRRVRDTLLAALPDRLEGTIFELGSGWGTLAFPLARRYPGCPVAAYELSPAPWAFSLLRALLSPLPNLTIHRSDFHRVSLARAVLVVCYLYPGGMARLRPKLEAELPAGALVVSNFFAVPGWTPLAVHRAADLEGSPVYLYRMPAPPGPPSRPAGERGPAPPTPGPMPS
ncbi:MAG: SAM-dependent methyltransferase [Thermodesulfobacteriota bacterium]